MFFISWDGELVCKLLHALTESLNLLLGLLVFSDEVIESLRVCVCVCVWVCEY